MTHDELVKWVEYLLICKANNNPHQPLSDKESDSVKSVDRHVSFKGYRLLTDRVAFKEARAKHDELMEQVKQLEQDYPQLKEGVKR